MGIDEVKDFVATVNNIKENFCSFDGEILKITTPEDSDPVTIELSDIESIELTKRKFTGLEVYIKSISGNQHIIAYAFANDIEEMLFDIKNTAIGAYYRFYQPALGFLVGVLVTSLFFIF